VLNFHEVAHRIDQRDRALGTIGERARNPKCVSVSACPYAASTNRKAYFPAVIARGILMTLAQHG